MQNLSRRELLKATTATLAALGLTSLLPGLTLAQKPARSPNIIFILSDDVGLSEIGCCGGHYATPHIDALAKSGTRFEYCYSTPLCGPSRCQCLTGRYPFRTGLISNQSADAVSPSRETMMPTIMTKAGYATCLVGKWGQICLGPGEWGFEDYLTFPGSGHYWSTQRGGDYTVNGQHKQLAETEYLPDVMHQYLVDYIQRHKDRPFYVHYSMSHIHGPILRTPDSKAGEKDERQLYADNVVYMDKLVGQLMATLDRLHLRENTLVLFVGDNGTARFGLDVATVNGRHIFGHKAELNEGGCRVPLVVNWPGTTPAGAVNRDLTDFSDFFPTFAELGGAAIPASLTIDGKSFAAQIRGNRGTPREWVYAELSGHAFVRDARYKLTDTGELLDLRDAPFDEVAIAPGSEDPGAIAARLRLQKVLDTHHPATSGGKAKTKKGQNRQDAQKPATEPAAPLRPRQRRRQRQQATNVNPVI